MQLRSHIHLGTAVTLGIGIATATTTFADPIPEPINKGSIVIELESVASGLTAPNYLTSARDGSGRLFAVDQPGQIRIIDNGVLNPIPFLDVSSRLPSLGFFGSQDENDFDERGLLGLAFHPDFASSGSDGHGKLYTFSSEVIDGAADFTVTLPPSEAFDHQSVITEWQIDANNANIVDPTSRRELMRIDNPQFNHNGGMIDFGPDRKLYIALGDGGSSNDNAPGHGLQGNGQDPSNVLGSILRIDVDGNNSGNGQYGVPVAAPFATISTDPAGVIPDETFAFGFRNPFRFSFDSEGGDLIAADVGQGNIEEIDIVTTGGNFGWRFKEGSFAFDFTDGSVSTDLTGIPSGLIDPVAEYDHDEGLSIIGGFVYRGSAIPELYGKYVFGDFSTGFFGPAGRLFYADLDTGLIQEFLLGLGDRDLGLFVKGFGQDDLGELYLLAGTNLGPFGSDGEVFRIIAAPVPLPAALWMLGAALIPLARTRRR